MGVLYFIALLAVIFPWAYGKYEAKGDHKKIIADAEKDSLKEQFHADNAVERGISLGLFSAGVMVLAHTFAGWPLWFGLVYFYYCTAVFGFVFTTHLNRLRGLPIFYVSHDPRASETDKFMVRGSAYFGMQPQSFCRLIYTVSLALAFLLLAGFVWWLYT